MARAACVPEPALSAVGRWDAYKRERRQPWTRSTWEANLRSAASDPEGFAASVDHTIAKGWQGLQAPKPEHSHGTTNGQRVTPTVATQRANLEALEAFARSGPAGAPLPAVPQPPRPGGHVGPEMRHIEGGAA